MTELKDVIETLDNAADSFESIADKEQKKIYGEVITLAKDLDLDASGKVKQSIANLKRLTQIKAKLAALSKDKEWVAGISGFAAYFGILQKQQNEYFSAHFPEHTLSEKAKEKNNLMRQMAVQNTMEALMGDGLKANVTDKLNDILLRAVTTGAKFGDLQEELRAHLLGKDGGQGAFARYATTYATTALSQYTGQTNKLLTEGLDTDWFMYTGSNKETTREFCEQLTKKKYIHRSEIATILTGRIDEYQCAIYPKTNLPYGMIEGTTVENFQCNCGGWNCRHQLVPVADAVVPASLRAKFAKKEEQPIRESKSAPDVNEYETWWQQKRTSLEFDRIVKDAKRSGVGIEDIERKGATREELDRALADIKENVKRKKDEYQGSVEELGELLRNLMEAGEANKVQEVAAAFDDFNWYSVKSGSDFKKQISKMKEIAKGIKEHLEMAKEPLYKNVVKDLQKQRIKYNEVKELEAQKSDEDIINSIGELDKAGSCASIALAYVGNKKGLDVADYRGGHSRTYFAQRTTMENIVSSLGGDVTRLKPSGDKDCYDVLGMHLMKSKAGHQYYCALAGHAAIFKNDGAGRFSYLDMQGNKSNNGWRSINKLNDLDDRFGINDMTKYASILWLDIDDVKNTPAFRKMLGYINTKNE